MTSEFGWEQRVGVREVYKEVNWNRYILLQFKNTSLIIMPMSSTHTELTSAWLVMLQNMIV